VDLASLLAECQGGVEKAIAHLDGAGLRGTRQRWSLRAA